MLNQCIEVGRVQDIFTDCIIINVPIEKDNNVKIKIICSETIMKNVNEYLNTEDLIGVKGHLVNDGADSIAVMADKITFLSSKSKEEDKDDNE